MLLHLWIFQATILSGLQFLLQRIFPDPGSNPSLPHCRQSITFWATREVQKRCDTFNQFLTRSNPRISGFAWSFFHLCDMYGAGRLCLSWDLISYPPSFHSNTDWSKSPYLRLSSRRQRTKKRRPRWVKKSYLEISVMPLDGVKDDDDIIKIKVRGSKVYQYLEQSYSFVLYFFFLWQYKVFKTRSF